jgi:hypothetical protein
LPLLPGPIFTQNFGAPKNLRRIPIRFQIVTKPKILKPFKNQQKTRALPVRKPAKFGQVLSPTKAIFGRGTHNEFEKKQKFEPFQVKSVQKNTNPERHYRICHGGQTSTAAFVYQPGNTPSHTARSKAVIYERFFENFLVLA